MKKKKVLYIKAQGLGDVISGIPHLNEFKQKGYEVYQTFYDIKFLTAFVPKKRAELFKKLPMGSTGWLKILEIFKTNGLIDNIIIIPFNIWGLFVFLFQNFRKFDEVVIPIKTKVAMILGKILGKKVSYVFEHTNDNNTYTNVIDGELGRKSPALFSYTKLVKRPEQEITLPKGKYVTVFASILERSIEIHDRIYIFEYLLDNKYEIIILGGDREKRFCEMLNAYPIYEKIHDYTSKTSLEQIAYIVKRSALNICCNGGIMRMANFLNPNNINIHTVSAFLMQPPVDEKHSFNVRPYTYYACKPCEAASMPQDIRIPKCVFYNTNKEGECRKIITGKMITSYIKRIYQTST